MWLVEIGRLDKRVRRRMHYYATGDDEYETRSEIHDAFHDESNGLRSATVKSAAATTATTMTSAILDDDAIVC